MRKLIVLLFLVTTTRTIAQSQQWVNYVNDYIINAVAVEGDIIWVGSQGGLSKINKVTGEKQDFLPFNSGMHGLGVNSIAIASDGTKWIGGNSGGLMRFDGINWTQYQYINTGDTLTSINKIEISPNGDVWIRSNVNANCSGCLKTYRFDGISFERMDLVFGGGGVPNGIISDFSIDGNGYVWIVATIWDQIEYKQKVFKYYNGKLLLSFAKEDLGIINDESISGIITAFAKRVYCLVQGNGSPGKLSIREYKGNSWSQILIDGQYTIDNYGEFKVTTDYNRIWIATYDNNLFALSYDGLNWNKYFKKDLIGLPKGPNSPSLLNVEQNNRIWIKYHTLAGMSEFRLFEYDGKNVNGYNTNIFPLTSNYIYDVAFDCNGSAILGGSDIITKFDGITWFDLTNMINGSSQTTTIRSISIDTSSCSLWISYYDGGSNTIGFSNYDGKNVKNYYTPNNANVLEVLPIGGGKLWVASSSDGLGYFNGTSWIWHNESNSPLYNFIYDIEIDNLNRIWVSSYSKGVFVFDGNTWLHFDELNSPVSNHSYSLLKDINGNIWINSIQKPIRFDGLNWFEFPNIPGENFSVQAQDLNGDFWLCDNYNMFKYDGNKYTKYSVSNSKLGTDYIIKIKIDPYGNKWIMHSAGISVFNENGISNQIINPPNSISGKVYFDTNLNGIEEPAYEPGIPGQKLILQPDNKITFSSYGGNYKFFPSPGNHEINFEQSSDYIPTSSTNLTCFMNNTNLSGYNFGAWNANPPDSISVEVTSGLSRCNTNTTVWVNVTNYGIFKASGTITLEFDPLLEFESSIPSPILINGNKITWSYSDLLPYEYNPIIVIFKNPDASYVGHIFHYYASASLPENSQVVYDNTTSELRCSIDPNEKQCSPVGSSNKNLSLVQDALDYTIYFQNKGNDTAFNIVIRDTLDSNLDPETFQLLDASALVRVTIDQGRILTFYFEQINLVWESYDEPRSQGFVKYRIKSKSNIPDNTTIKNTAHIYFDFNPDIVTNTTENILVEKLTSTQNLNASKVHCKIFPNPSAGVFSVELQNQENLDWNLIISDVNGKVYVNDKITKSYINISNLPLGIYNARISADNEFINKIIIVTQ